MHETHPRFYAPGMPAPHTESVRHSFVLTVSCPDQPGLVHAVTGVLLEASGNIRQSQQFEDERSGLFFMRIQFDVSNPSVDRAALAAALTPVAEARAMAWHLYDADEPTRTLLLTSRFGHCVNDLLYRRSIGALNIDVPAVVSNHPDAQALATTYGIPFHHVPVTPATKAESEARLRQLIEELDVSLVVLARYMQVLSDEMCTWLQGRAINIHHSFLPSFKGARPYQQAHERGVKLVGATAHFVTPELDEGPIIEQDVTRIDHAFTPEDAVAAGRDVESAVLARAIKWHSEHRVLLNGTRTVVFR